MEPRALIWQQAGWPALRHDTARVATEVGRALRAQGAVEGKLAALGFEQRQHLTADAWTQEAVSTSAIEGERLDLLAVRCSVARRLGVAHDKASSAPRHIDGLLDIMDDAVANACAPLSHERLQGWQAALFPTGFSGTSKVLAGAYRQHADPMQIVSGRIGHESVRYVAPPWASVPEEMERFLQWFNGGSERVGLVLAALAHLWFETVHPFEDGDARVGRVIVDLALARDAGEATRLIRISQRLLERRDDYYEQLERAQHGSLDATEWIVWFVAQVRVACEQASEVIDQSLFKARFWSEHRDKNLTPRQRKVVNALLDAGPRGFAGGMSTRKYESLTSASRATSSRELIELAELGLFRSSGGGRSTRYSINLDGWAD